MTTTFKTIGIEDKEEILAYTLDCNDKNCELSFANLCAWQMQHHAAYSIINRQLVIKFTIMGKHHYYMPIGKGDTSGTIKLLYEDAILRGENLRMRGIMPEAYEVLDSLYPGCFDYLSNRDYADYVYLRSNLVNLSGKDYQPKRNHLNKFKNTYAYEYIPITDDMINECKDFTEEWCKERDCNDNETLHNEGLALKYDLEHMNVIGAIGAVLKVDNKIVALTIGAPINHNTFGIHFEKALTIIDGAYTAINREFASRLPEQYIYLNREEDLGISGLRKAKMSYHPAQLLFKCYAALNEQGVSKLQ